MLIIKTNRVKTWDINYPQRYNLFAKKIPQNIIIDNEEIINKDLLKYNFVIKLKR